MSTDTGPLKRYIAARDALLGGARELALHLAQDSLRSPARTPAIDNNLERLLDPETLAGEVMLQLVLHETRRKIE